MLRTVTVRLRVLSFLWVVVLGACRTPAGSGAVPAEDAHLSSAGNILAGAKPWRSRGVRHAQRMTDGVAAVDGDHWRTDLTAVLESHGSEVVYDLGGATWVSSIFLQADNNDEFRISMSDDGERFWQLWTARRGGPPGMQPRQVQGLHAKGRFLRLTAVGGDAYVSVAELMVFSEPPEAWPPSPLRRRGLDPAQDARRLMVLLGLALSLFMLVNDRRVPLSLQTAVALTPAAVGAALAMTWREVWPIAADDISLLRAVIAVTAGFAVLRLMVWPRHTGRRATNAVLAVLAALAIGGFFNFGNPQFFNHKEKRGMFAHVFDGRVYFPVVKYFEELRFDGVYLASVAALVEDEPGVTISSLAGTQLRDLKTNNMVVVRDVVDEVERVKYRFSSDRWAQFKRDMRWFWESMGRGAYLGSLRDHGGNATPVWILLTRGIYGWAPANEITLTLAGLLDPILLAFVFVVIGRTFGLRSALLSVIVFGATDFPMLGSNWAGAALRFDWMVALGLAVCALKVKRWVLGGVLLGLAGLLRAFPALSCALLAVPAAWWLGERIFRDKALPSREALRVVLRPLVRTAAGGVVCVVTLVLLSGLAFSFSGAWGTWIHKISIHSAKFNVNHVGLRTLAAYDPDLVARKVMVAGHPEPWVRWQETQLATLEAREPLYWTVMAFFILLALAACRRLRLYQAALVGSLLIPIVFYPANYYLHYIFVLPLLVDDRPDRLRRWGWNCLFLLGLCGFQYITLGQPTDERFTDQSWMLLGTYLAMMLALIWGWRKHGAPQHQMPEHDSEFAEALA